jgi:hypothetical protein
MTATDTGGKLPAGITIALAFVLLLAAVLGGCVSRSKAQAQARLAYLAGQRDARAQMEQEKARGPGVTFLGPVRSPLIPWFDGLTLSQAIVNAHCYAASDPNTIVIRRNDQEIQVDPKKLLAGEDIPLQAGDVIELRQ